MNNIETLLKEVSDKLFNYPCVKEYFRLKDIIENDEKISSLEKEVREHQKLMCEHQNEDERYFKEKELYESKLAELQANPIIQNFEEVKKEVNALLNEVRDILN